jgi:hypothetical protein
MYKVGLIQEPLQLAGLLIVQEFFLNFFFCLDIGLIIDEHLQLLLQATAQLVEREAGQLGERFGGVAIAVGGELEQEIGGA